MNDVKTRCSVVNCQNCRNGTCHCGCGQPAPIAKSSASKWGHVKGQPQRFIKNHHLVGMVRSLSQRINASRQRTGHEPTLSPFIPDTIVAFHRKGKRWTCGVSSGWRGTHAKAVWKYFNGPTPEGMRVHHKNGDPSKLENDAPDNLMLLTEEWNLEFMPKLAKGFNIHESEVTQAYLLVEHLPYEQRFPEVCRILLEPDRVQESAVA